MERYHKFFILLPIFAFFTNGLEIEHCLDGKSRSNGCIKCDENNHYFSFSFGCICEIGYILNPEETECIKNPISNCEKLSTIDTCLSCSKGRLSADKKNCENTEIKNCHSSYFEDGIEYCELCETGYQKLLSVSKCIKSIPNCMYADEEEGSIKCVECDYGFVRSDDGKQCISCGKNCGKCEKSGNQITCKECKEGYEMKEGKCEECDDKKCEHCIENCKYCPDSSTCTICNEGYGINEGSTKCWKCSNKCDTCAFHGNVEVCWQCHGNNGIMKRIQTDYFSGYGMECASKYLMVSFLLLLLFFLY